LLQRACSTAYYQPKLVSGTALALMRRIDELYSQYPFSGVACCGIIISAAYQGLERYLMFDSQTRPHQGLDGQTTDQGY